MVMKLPITSLVVIVPLFVCTLTTNAQVGRSFWIQVKDDYATVDSGQVTFGNWSDATYGVDNLGGACQEYLDTPPPPSFDIRWMNIPGRTNVYQLGLLKFDFISLTSASGIDTFVLRCSNGDPQALHANFTLRWPDASYLHARCDSMFLVDPSDFALATTIDMLQQQSVTITDPGNIFGAPDFKLRIFIYGSHYIDPSPCTIADVGSPQTHSVPTSFVLHQNYPNPFNPSTIINYDLPVAGHVTLRVYNILGQEIATLVNGIQEAGYESITFNANNLSSGVYFYRLQDGKFVETKMLMITK